MNSEQLKIINDITKQAQIPDALDIKFHKIANQMSDLIEMPAWKQLVSDYQLIRAKLVSLLLDAKTVKEMQGLQNRIKDIDLIIDSPVKHIRQSQIYLKRRKKW